jgi:hypothetical protein
MKNLNLLLILAALIIAMPGCASRDNLSLSNTLEEKNERAKRLEEKERQKQLQTAQTAPVKQVLTPKPLPLEELIRNSTTNPPELAFFKLPEDFVEMTSEEQSLFQEEQIKRPNLAGFIPRWRDQNSRIYILVDKAFTNREEITSITKEEFLQKIRFGIARYEEFYREIHRAKITFKESSWQSLITLQISSRYLYKDTWHADDRQTFFYTPDYRLNLLITGPDEDLLKIRKKLDENLWEFKKNLALYFPDGIQFRQD